MRGLIFFAPHILLGIEEYMLLSRLKAWIQVDA